MEIASKADKTGRNGAFRLALAILLPLVACAIQWMLWRKISPFVWFLFFPTVFFSAWLGGMAGGLASTVISTALVWYFFIPPQLSWSIQNPNNLFSVALFIVMGFFFSLVFSMLKKANLLAEESLAAAESANLHLEESNQKISSLYEKTKEIDTLKTQFFANVSHELRTPLALILGPISKWLKNEDFKEQTRSELEIVERNARLLHRQVNDLLDVAKLEAGRMTMQYAQADLAYQVRVIASHFTNLAEERSIAFSVEADTNIPAQIDIEKFHRIALNLLSNAFKFTPDHGSVHVSLAQADDRVVLKVQDSGKGIPEDKQEIIFELFRQIDGQSNRQYGGTGLGLSIVKEFVSLHGGKVTVENVQGGGALFTVTLPTNAPSDKEVLTEAITDISDDISTQLVEELRPIKAVEHTNSTSLTIDQATVLVVEDNPDMNSFICSVLQPHYRVMSAYNGSGGLQAAVKSHPDLILSDIMMPGMSGDVMVEEIRSHAELENIPIILLTAKADDDLQIKMLKSGVTDYIRKPFLPDELLARISVVLSERLESRKKLHLSEDRYASLVKASPTGIFQTDRYGNCLYVNEHWCEISGMSQEDAGGTGWSQALHPEDRQNVFDSWNHAVANNVTFKLEYRFQHKNGDVIWVYGQAVATTDLSGEITGYVGTITDISERKQIENALREQEHRYRSIFDSSPVAIGIGDIQKGRLIDINGAWLQLFGYKRTEVLGQSTVELGMYVKENERDEIVGMIRNHSRVVNYPIQLRRKNKDILDILYSAEIITLDAQPYLQVMMTDVTERKHLDEAIKHIKMLFEQSFEQSPVAKVLVTMPDAIIHSVNPACLELLGIIEEPSIIGSPLLDYKPPFLDYDRYGNLGILKNLPLARAMRGEKTINEERRIVRKDGTERWVLVSCVPVCDTNGTVIAGYLIMVDITSRKQAGSEIRRLTTILNESQQLARVGGWEIDLINNNLYWTDETYRIHDTSPEEYIPTLETAIAFYAPESVPIISKAVKDAIEENKNFNLELKLITAKGRPILVHTTCRVIMENGKPVKIMGAFKDITEQKRLEDQLHQAQKMESIGSLAGGVAHDFNNKLSVILGYANLATIESNPVLLKQYLDEIRKAGEQSADLTRQLLAFARKQTISPIVLDLNETVSGMLKMLNRLIGEDIHLIWHPAPDLWLLKLDPSQIDQILANLCVNARDSISADGKITIETANSLIDDDYCSHHADALPGEYVRLVVSDNGCGMDKGTVDRIFEPFFTTKETGKGTGLGLSTVFGIVKQNNGFIRVYSEQGIGTTFTIYLPRYEGTTAQTLKKDMKIPTSIGSETILIVEDELAILNMASMILSKLGYTVLSANSPVEANRLAITHTGDINLLITDMIMPGINGKDLAHDLQLRFPKLKCLFMSGYTADAISQHGVLDEGVNFIQKPFSLPDMANKVREVLDSKSETT